MTGTLEAPAIRAGRRSDRGERPAPRPRAGLGARWRIALLLAARQVRRTWASSLLVIALVAMPISVMAGAAVLIDSRTPTLAEKQRAELGKADAWLMIVGGPDETRQQYLDDPFSTTQANDPSTGLALADEPAPRSLDGIVPASLDLIPIGLRDGIRVETAAGVGALTAIVGEAWDPALTGRYEVLEGRAPTTASEAMVGPGALERLGIEVGGKLTLIEPAATFIVTGVLKEATAPDDQQTLFLPETPDLAIGADPRSTQWFASKWKPTPEDVYALNAKGVVAYARDLVATPGDGASPMFGQDGGSTATLVVLWGAGIAFTSYVVILLAGAAFAVSARRQQRSLAMAASVGATRRDVFRIVLLQGTVLGLIGGALGTAVGIGGGAAALHLLDTGAAADFWGFHLPWIGLAAIMLFATIVGTVTAIAPARSATRGDVIGALRGARRPVTVDARRPIWGTILLVGGVALSVVSVALMVSLDILQEGRSQTEDPRFGIGVAGMIVGPILFQAGVIVAGHWVLSLVSRGLSRMGLGPRIASRDTAANPGRAVPAFAAIAACAFLAATAMGVTGTTMANGERTYSYRAPLHSFAVEVGVDATAFPPDDESRREAEVQTVEAEVATALRTAGAEAVGLVSVQREPARDPRTAEPLATDGPGSLRTQLQDYTPCGGDDDDCTTAYWAAASYEGIPAFVDPDELTTIVDGVTEADVVAFRSGEALVMDPRWQTDDGRIVLNEFAWDSVDRGGATVPATISTHTFDARVLSLGHRIPWPVLLPISAAADLEIGLMPKQFVGAMTDAPADTAFDHLREDLDTTAQTHAPAVYVIPSVESGPDDPATIVWLILGVVTVLVVGAATIALGLARFERRPDDATLAAVGGTRRLRRAVSWWQALIITGIGCVTGALATLLPIWGFVTINSGLQNGMFLADVPWPVLAILALGLPLMIAVAAWLVPPRDPDLTRRTAIA